ncbi:FMN-binding protein [Amycolatopsis sp. H20-H5]|uniref:FMN-binding protein n=1 Tax=Amycolatopsis sp. H20-H5 TaxID=3046309 RepID=UPI002DB8236C|nr:FMN-binding protein [Amycolatopsis sp. H20-H5]MEC3973760.1 FMN-binding protein [Amycolatopsis sp. H20-H5]
MKRTILVLLLSAAGFAAVWRFEPAPLGSTVVAQAPSVTAPATPSTSAGGATIRVVPGSAESSDYGTVQVQVLFSGTTITDVQLLQEPDSGRGVRALPTLREEALQAQSAKIDTVSGATSTSESYAKSLQAALDARGA